MSEDKVTVENGKDFLYVKVEGIRDNFQQVIEGSSRIRMLAEKYRQPHILADYSEVKFELNLSEAFNLIRLYESKLPDFRNYKLAAVVRPQDSEIAGFYESIGKKRGFDIRAFTNLESAKKWFEEQEPAL